MEKDVLTQKKSIGLPITLICIGFCLSVLLLISGIYRVLSGYSGNSQNYIIFAYAAIVVAFANFVAQIAMLVYFIKRRNEIGLLKISFASNIFLSLIVLLNNHYDMTFGIILAVLSTTAYALMLAFKHYDNRPVRVLIMVFSLSFVVTMMIYEFISLAYAAIVISFLIPFFAVAYLTIFIVLLLKNFIHMKQPDDEKNKKDVKKRGDDRFDDLRELKKLYDEGVLTEQEFSKAKEKILEEK